MAECVEESAAFFASGAKHVLPTASHAAPNALARSLPLSGAQKSCRVMTCVQTDCQTAKPQAMRCNVTNTSNITNNTERSARLPPFANVLSKFQGFVHGSESRIARLACQSIGDWIGQLHATPSRLQVWLNACLK